ETQHVKHDILTITDYNDYTISFFFQAEDGIRDFHVTGVQTCALPIFERYEEGCKVARRSLRFNSNAHSLGAFIINAIRAGDAEEIGRASCRERVWISVGDESRRRGV